MPCSGELQAECVAFNAAGGPEVGLLAAGMDHAIDPAAVPPDVLRHVDLRESDGELASVLVQNGSAVGYRKGVKP